MARLPQFTRKGAPPINADTGDDTSTPDNSDTSDGSDGADVETADDGEQQDANEIAVCPACGCAFNDETGKVLNDTHPQHPQHAASSDDGSGGDEA